MWSGYRNSSHDSRGVVRIVGERSRYRGAAGITGEMSGYRGALRIQGEQPG
jgi:hypothetical protein